MSGKSLNPLCLYFLISKMGIIKLQTHSGCEDYLKNWVHLLVGVREGEGGLITCSK